MRSILVALLCALGLLCGCTSESVQVPATQLLVRVSASPDVQNSLARLRLRTTGASGGAWGVRRETNFDAAVLKWPVELVLIPPSEAEADHLFEVIVDALDADTALLVQARALVSFELRKAHTLELSLEMCGARGLCPDAEDCLGPECQTCMAGACVDTPTYDPHDLPSYPAESEVDAGADEDAGSEAGELSEAGPIGNQMDTGAGDADAGAAGMDAAEDAALAEAGSCATGCAEGGVDSGSDASSATPEAGSDAGPACSSADNACSGSDLKLCNAQGSGFTSTTCAVDCAAAPTPHCTHLHPSAPVLDQDLAAAGLTEINFGADAVLNTDTGSISGGVTRAANTVASKREINAGIAFHQTADGYGVFSFARLTLANGATLKLIGESGAILVSADTFTVRGLIDARPMDASGALCPATRVAGPGAGRGGPAGSVACCPTYTNGGPGEGPGGGKGGIRPMQGGNSGGGGAGHFAAGGKGGDSCHQLQPATSGGNGGASYSTGYEGGSGGAGGGLADGGGGGGAVRLVAGLVITIGDGLVLAGINAGGCGGKGGLGAGGGGSGGSIVLEAPFVQVMAKGTLAANGGSGGASPSSTATDGVPGQLSAAPALAPGNTPASAGEGNGGAGDAPAGHAVINTVCGTLEGAGGGGSAGAVQIRSTTPTVSGQAILSPSIASNGAKVVAADVH